LVLVSVPFLLLLLNVRGVVANAVFSIFTPGAALAWALRVPVGDDAWFRWLFAANTVVYTVGTWGVLSWRERRRRGRK
jgi:hypothetical protein